jgi:hypothetical protein
VSRRSLSGCPAIDVLDATLASYCLERGVDPAVLYDDIQCPRNGFGIGLGLYDLPYPVDLLLFKNELFSHLRHGTHITTSMCIIFISIHIIKEAYASYQSSWQRVSLCLKSNYLGFGFAAA